MSTQWQTNFVRPEGVLGSPDVQRIVVLVDAQVRSKVLAQGNLFVL